MDKISLCPFTDNDEAKVTNLLVLKITREESHSKALDALYATERTLGILVDNTAEVLYKREYYHHEFYRLPQYCMPAEQQSPISS